MVCIPVKFGTDDEKIHVVHIKKARPSKYETYSTEPWFSQLLGRITMVSKRARYSYALGYYTHPMPVVLETQ